MPELEDVYGKRVKSEVWHLNPAGQIEAMVLVNCDGEVYITWAGDTKYMRYKGRSNELVISDPVIGETNLSKMTLWELTWKLCMRPTFSAILDMAEYFDHVRYFKGKGGESGRFEVALSGDGSAGAERPDTLTIWVSPETKLIEKCDLKIIEKEGVKNYLFGFSYGGQDIGGIYDLGVPKDAIVIDNRLTVEEKAVCERLDRRIKEGFGDFAAVLTESIVGSNGTLKKNQITLFGQKSEALTYEIYPLNEMAITPTFVSMEGWPTPDICKVLERVKTELPYFFFITDGQKGWHGVYDKGAKSYKGLGEIVNKRMIVFNESKYDLPGRIWPGFHDIAYDRKNTDASVNLVKSEKNPEESKLSFGLVFSDADSARNDIGRYEWICRIDTGRDGMPIEQIKRDYGVDRETVKIERKTKYNSFEKLRGRQYYPTSWRTERTAFAEDGTGKSMTLEYHLTIYPDMRLDDWWFRGLGEKLIGQAR